jgi:hypothetical protein
MLLRTNVRFGSFSDFGPRASDVGFTPVCGHRQPCDAVWPDLALRLTTATSLKKIDGAGFWSRLKNLDPTQDICELALHAILWRNRCMGC